MGATMKKIIVLLAASFALDVSAVRPSFADTTSTRTVVQGIVHSELNVAGPNVVEVLEIDLKNPYLRLETYRANLLAATSAQAAANDSAGHRVIAAVNGDYFGTNGWPMDNAVVNGKPLIATATAGYRSHLAITEQAKPYIEQFAFAGSLVAKNGSVLLLSEVNSWRMSGTTALFNSFYGATTGTDGTGIECSLIPLFTTWRANDTLLFVVTSVQSAGNTVIPPSGIVVSAGSGTPSTFITNNVAVNDTVKVFVGFNPNSIRKIVHLIGGAGRLVKNGLNVANNAARSEGLTSTFYNVRNSRTFAGFNADTSKFYFCTVDLNTPSVGMTFDEMANFLLSIKVSDAYNLDGGGSTTMVVQGKVVNYLPGGERSVGTTLQVVSSALTGSVAILNILEEHAEVRQDTTFQFHTECKDFYLNTLPLPSGVKWSADSMLGSIDSNGFFKSKKVVDSGWVRVQFGTVSDSARVVVLKPLTGVAPPLAGSPFPYSLEQNYPNPFNPTTTIEYSLPHQVWVRLTVYDLVGREVITLANELQSAGSHAMRFDASALGSGTYFYQIVAGEQRSTRKLLLLK